MIGSHTDLEDLRRVAEGADVLTFDHEHVPTELLDKLVAEGINVAPPPQALVHAQDKLVMRRRLEALGVPVPRYAEIRSVDELDEFARGSPGPWWSRRSAAVTTGVGCGWPATRCTPARSRPPSWPTACR